MEQIEALTSLVSDLEKTGSEHVENDRENRSIIRDLEEVLSDTEVILRARSRPGHRLDDKTNLNFTCELALT